MLKYAEDEVDFVVQKIKGLLVGGCRYRDITIVAGSLETYGSIIEHSMKKAGIACFVDQKRGVQSSVPVRAIDALLQIIIKDFDPDIVIGCGGYVTAPVIYAAKKLGKKTFIHEQNSVVGLANKF